MISIRITLATVLLTAGANMTAYAQLANGAFTDGLTGWSTEGSVRIVPSPIGNNGVVMDELIPAARSRIHQTFAIPAHPSRLVFWYKLANTPAARPAALPPDSFTAFLLDSNGLRIQAGDAPAFTQGFLYADGDRRLNGAMHR